MRPKVLYCHFSFRRPKGKEYGIFACAVYIDFEGKKIIARRTKAAKLWVDDPHITAVQAYSEALKCLYDWQGKILDIGVKQILLVTDNSNLTKWISNPKKYKGMLPWMNKCYEPYHLGNRGFKLVIGLLAPRNSEKSYKYCKEDLIDNWNEYNNLNNNSNKTELDIGGLKSIEDILSEDVPEGLNDFKPISV